MMRRVQRYGWIPDLPDARDTVYMVPRAVRLPPKVDLRPHCPPVYDQGQLGSCTANAIGAAVQFERMKQKLTGASAAVPSRLFIYYNERVVEGTVSEDAGAQIRDGIKSVNRQGVCFETQWPYNIAKFTTRPPKPCYRTALHNQALSYARINPTLGQMRGCLASGWPFVFGFSVYDSFEGPTVARTGRATMPKPDEQLLGGHAVMAVGYDDAQKRFLVRNSWGVGWGLRGYFTMPYAYLTDRDLSDDFWTVRLVEA